MKVLVIFHTLPITRCIRWGELSKKFSSSRCLIMPSHNKRNTLFLKVRFAEFHGKRFLVLETPAGKIEIGNLRYLWIK